MLKNLQSYVAPPALLAGRNILITGASEGIGKAVACAAAASGATVILLARKVKKLEKVYDEIVAAGHPRPTICPFDLEKADWEAHMALAEGLQNECGHLDGLVHNAGLLGNRSPIEHYDAPMWERVLKVNATAPFLLTRACMPLLKTSKDASVIFVSSSVGRKGRAYWGAYAVSKFALEGLMQTLADETEENTSIRANSLNPGATRTKMRQSAYPSENPNSLPTPEEIAPAFLYLLGPDSKEINGAACDVR